MFVGLRNQHSRLAGLQDTTLQYEILSWDRCLQEDLVVMLLDELKKGKEKNVALIRSKEAAVSYLTKKVKEMAPAILDRVANLEDLIKEGLDERINQLKY